MRVSVAAVLLVVILVAVAGVGAWVLRGRSAVPARCDVAAPSGHYRLELDQAANAATIAAVAKTAGLPDHAVTVALAAALQESGLHNVTGGDRDSVGLFQQRPSEGWGTRAEILEPRYSATAFYDALRKVPGWAEMPVTEAAQLVQRSAAPDAYAAWESQARAMAAALTGETSAGVACQFDLSVHAPAAGSLASAMDGELGSASFTVADPAHQWLVAQWLVAHAYTYHITSVAFGHWRWTNGRSAWLASTPGRSELAITEQGSSAARLTAAVAE